MKKKSGRPRKFTKTFPLYMNDKEYAKLQSLSCSTGRTMAAELRRMIDKAKDGAQ